MNEERYFSDEELKNMIDNVKVDEQLEELSGTVPKEGAVPLSAEEKRDLEAIQNIEKVLGVKYSDEQLKVLKHHGNACILACAGSGKTTILTNLVAKRLMTGEIAHGGRLLCTTYSKDGAVELEERLRKLFDKLGIKQTVQVKTIHAFCYAIINRYFPGMYKIIDESTSLKLIRQACAEAKFKPKDDDIMLISSLLSFQVNNLLNDSSTISSPACKIEDLELSQYTTIRMTYNNKKREEKLLDFDDMQLIMWSWLVKEKNKEVLGYCKSLFDHYLIDEAQDMSRIQYQIIRALVTEVDNQDKLEKTLVVVGDEDQCLVEGTKVTMADGTLKNIEDIQVGDKVLSAFTNGRTVEAKVDAISKKEIDRKILTIKTSSGASITCTPEHIGFVSINSDDINTTNIDKVTKFTDIPYIETQVKNISTMNTVPLYLNGVTNKGERFQTIQNESVITVYTEDYKGFVYDLSVPSTRNFIANNIVVHNCIYKWRGADPSIILDICPEFDIKKFVLSTNYRCQSEIVGLASVGIRNNKNRVDKDMKAFKDGGKVKLLKTSHLDMYDMSKTALNYIKELVDSGVSPDDIAVLSRNNFHLAILSNMCFREGIYSNVSVDMRLTRNIMYKDIKAIIGLVDNPWNMNNVRQVLWKMCRYLGINSTSTILDFQDKSALSFELALGYLLHTFTRYKDNITLSRQVDVPAIVRERMRAFVSALSTDSLADLFSVYCCITSKDKEKGIKYMFDMYINSSCSFIYKNKDKERTAKGLVRYVVELLDNYGLDKTLEFFRMSEQLEEGKMAIPGPKVTMSTMHSAKGREWEHVIIFGDDNIAMPNFSYITKMIADGVSIHDINSYIDEDRRLHYVATTRAKSDLAIITSTDMSVYLLEALGLFKDDVNGTNYHIMSMAQNGYIYPELYNILEGKVFGVSNRYYDKPNDNTEDVSELHIEMKGDSNDEKNT